MDLNQYSDDQLAKLKHQIEEELVQRAEIKRQQVIENILAAANEANLSREEIIKALGGKGKTTGRKVAIKYRDPSQPENTWSGRGRKPLWVVAYLDQGGSLESLAV